MVVDGDVAESLRGGEPVRLAIFVASCTERMAQLFTGLRGVDPGRGQDVDLYLDIQGDLWNLDLSEAVFCARVDALQEFIELRPSEEGVVAVDDLYAFYGVLCIRYAALYRANGDAEDAVRCAHASLTALGQLDRNLSQIAFFEGGREYQRRAMLIDIDVEGALLRLRDSDQVAGRERLIAVKARM